MARCLVCAVVVIGLALGAPGCSKKETSAEGPGVLADEAEALAEAEEQESGQGGWLEIRGAGLEGQEVRKAGTSERIDVISASRSVIPLPAGSYDVVFGRGVWRGVVVVEDKTTTLVPGWISVSHASLQGHEILDAATGTVQGSVSSLKDTIALIPGSYVVMFGRLPWPVEARTGETLVLRPGIVEVPYADVSGHRIYERSGALAGEVSNIQSSIPLPPGEYEIEMEGARIAFSLAEGETRRFERP